MNDSVEYPDGRRPANGAEFPLNPLTNLAISPKTAAYTISDPECRVGCAYSNEGAGGSVTFTIPAPPFVGAKLHFFKQANQNVVLSGSINGASTLSNTASEQNSGYVQLVGISSTAWRVKEKQGTWA